MEKLVDSMRGETYSLLLIADPVSANELQIIKRGYEKLYSQLVPFVGSELNFGRNDSVSVSKGITKGLSKSINKSVTDTLTHTEGTSESHTEGITKTKGANVNLGVSGGLAGAGIGFLAGGPLGAVIGGAIGGALGGSATVNTSTSKNVSDTTGTNKSDAASHAETTGETDTESTNETDTDTIGEGTNRGIQLKFEDKAVLQMAPFGREVSSHLQGADNEQYGNKITLGNIHHMGKEENLPVILNKKSLTSHVFITGSTGSGKSNTVYTILNEARRADAKFLVIEPAKGEYKNVFGNDVKVYGTNPELSPLLRINPFTFNEGIHILEHLDRLVEIFNVCWPMYAAMPAVLKDAIEVSYKKAGWNLITSKNIFPKKLYPTFADVAENIRKIIDTSEYSEENKGNYKGALITRLKSLSNGINGLIFTNEELGNKELFDENVIVDLSRIGSMETKALIMGILVMKLQEYRMTSGKMNADLQHITVLEEAHNLLKRTSTEQTSESANLLGKSVEMIANAIAEMRTYGEGFIIADQSPGLLDMSVIRNTNTKIIMRLPDESDRELVGKAAGLNDDQVVELTRLQCGVAAIYQNDWIQPVLCKVSHFKTPDTLYKFDSARVYEKLTDESELTALKKRIALYLLSNMIDDPPKENIDNLKEAFLGSTLTTGLKAKIIGFIDSQKPPVRIESISDMIAGLYDYSGIALEKLNKGINIDSIWAKMLFDDVRPRIDGFSEQTQMIIMNCIITEISHQSSTFRDLPEKWADLGRRH